MYWRTKYFSPAQEKLLSHSTTHQFFLILVPLQMCIRDRPTAINMSLIAIEMKNNPEYATQIVMGTTILSAITMPLFITIAYYLFPLY